MIQSMTGFGKCIKAYENKRLSITIKALNSKQQDTSLRLPMIYKDYELELRNIISERLIRGKIECIVNIEESIAQVSDTSEINNDAVKYYLEQIKTLSEENKDSFSPLTPSWTDIIRLPGVLKSRQEQVKEEISQDEINTLKDTLNEAIDELVAFRKQEGEMLYNVLSENISNISVLLKQIERPESERIQMLRERIEDSLSKLQVDYDKNRLEQEMIYYIEKVDINEEKTRLQNHLSFFMETLNQEDVAQGKNLGFIAQEIGREINTMGSKSNNAEMQQIVVKMKDNLEQIKEQILNVL